MPGDVRQRRQNVPDTGMDLPAQGDGSTSDGYGNRPAVGGELTWAAAADCGRGAEFYILALHQARGPAAVAGSGLYGSSIRLTQFIQRKR